MGATRLGAIVWTLQWPLAVLLPVFVFFGRGLLGAEIGWMGAVGLLIGPILLILLLIPPILSVFDLEARRAAAAPRNYAVASVVLWMAMIVAGLALSDGGDVRPFPSSLERWTGMGPDAAAAIVGAAVVIGTAAWIGMLITAIRGIVRARPGLLSGP